MAETTEATVVVIEREGRFSVKLTLADGSELITEDDYDSKEHALRAFRAWMHAVGASYKVVH